MIELWATFMDKDDNKVYVMTDHGQIVAFLTEKEYHNYLKISENKGKLIIEQHESSQTG